MSTKETGSRGEHIAARFCISRGMRIVARNWRSGKGEIDLIARDQGILVFIEVKYRTSLTFGYPEESITPHKQRMLLSTLAAFLAHHPHSQYRVDVISILSLHGKATLKHFRAVELLA